MAGLVAEVQSELIVNVVSRNSNKSTHSPSNVNRESPLKKAIKENETVIIQGILSPLSTTTKNGSSTDGDTIVTEGLSSLLDYLFEDGQLTRVEYDFVDKARGMESAQEQAQALLRILTETKDDEALEVFLRYLKRLDSCADSVTKLCASIPGSETSKNIYSIKTRPFSNDIGNYSILSKFQCGESHSRKKQHDFYYGRNQRKRFEDVSNGRDDETDTGSMGMIGVLNDSRQQINKTTPTKEVTDFRDFYLTPGCLETVRNLILECKESLTPLGWERVLRNMNGVLATDVVSIKDLLFQIKCSEHQSEVEEEKRMIAEVRRIERETQQQQGQMYENINAENAIGENSNDVDDDDENETRTSERVDQLVNWDQIIYHSLQVWKQRNGLNSVFYSLIGVFQHSRLYQTSDILLRNKIEIQARENEKDVENSDIDRNGRRASTTSTMLEKSDFLRKFYTPSRSSIKSSTSLTTTKDRVTASPVLSLDLV